MVSARRLMFLGGAALLSGATVFLTQQWLQGQLNQASAVAQAQAAPAAAAQVLVARQTLPPGTILKPEHVRWQPWPADASTAGYITSGPGALKQVTGAVLRSEVAAGAPLAAAGVVQPGDRSFLAAVLKPGYRAMTVNVSASTGVAGFIFPGDRVDLILSRAVGGPGSQRFVSETVVSDVRVVGMDQRAANEKKEVVVPQTATLEVTPKQAEVIAVVSELGKLSLSLRSLAVADAPPPAREAVTRTWDHEAVQAPVAAPRPAAARPPPTRPAVNAAHPAVEVVRGGQFSSSGSAR